MDDSPDCRALRKALDERDEIITELRAENAELYEALAPFAKIVSMIDARMPDRGVVQGRHGRLTVTAGDFRRAAKLCEP